MGARTKLNSVYLIGSLVIAGVLGAAAQSWTVFVIAAVVLLACSVYEGGIQLKGRRRYCESPPGCRTRRTCTRTAGGP